MSGGADGQGQPQPAPGAEPEPVGSRPLHKSPFKLRFAQCRELGRSDVSLVKPLGLPSTVTDKFYSGRRQEGSEAAREAAALARIRDLFRCGPRDKYPRPLTSAHEYGWHGAPPPARDPRLQHHIRDSAWLKARIRVLHADALLKQR